MSVKNYVPRQLQTQIQLRKDRQIDPIIRYVVVICRPHSALPHLFIIALWSTIVIHVLDGIKHPAELYSQKLNYNLAVIYIINSSINRQQFDQVGQYHTKATALQQTCCPPQHCVPKLLGTWFKLRLLSGRHGTKASKLCLRQSNSVRLSPAYSGTGQLVVYQHASCTLQSHCRRLVFFQWAFLLTHPNSSRRTPQLGYIERELKISVRPLLGLELYIPSRNRKLESSTAPTKRGRENQQVISSASIWSEIWGSWILPSSSLL